MRIPVRLALAFILVFPATALFAQQHNYTQGDIEEGGRLFRLNCIGCHGPEGNMVTGIDLGRNRFRRVSTDEEIVKVIQSGVPNTGMPPNPMTTLRAYNVVGFLRNMNASSAVKSIAAASGDAVRGKALFTGKGACNTCHRVRGEGSVPPAFGRPEPGFPPLGDIIPLIHLSEALMRPPVPPRKAS